MAYPATDLSQVVAAEFVDENDWNALVSALNFLADPPACRVYNSAAISIPNNALTALTFNSERFDTDSMHSTSSLTSRITFNTAGLYVITAQVEWPNNGTGFRRIGILANSATYIAFQSTPALTGDTHIMSVTTPWKAAVGNYVEALVHQTSGGALNASAAPSVGPEFSAVWVGRG